MPVTVVVGAQWGDEGKAKVIDLLSKEHTYVVRYQGGHNAGHTVVVDGERYALQLIPSGILYDHVIPVIANGVVVDLPTLFTEVAALEARGVSCADLRCRAMPTSCSRGTRHTMRSPRPFAATTRSAPRSRASARRTPTRRGASGSAPAMCSTPSVSPPCWKSGRRPRACSSSRRAASRCRSTRWSPVSSNSERSWRRSSPTR